VRELIDPADLGGVIETDSELDAADHSHALAEQLEHAVWGQSFAAPLFRAIFDVVTQRGGGEKHLKLPASLQRMHLACHVQING
jgi:single-stranded-DNA-specific exonuclease